MEDLMNCKFCSQSFDEVKLIELIVTTNQRRGKGTMDSPIRIITQYWCKSGNHLVFEFDPQYPPQSGGENK